ARQADRLNAGAASRARDREMTGGRMNPIRGACAIALLFACAPAAADWLPQWVGVWQHEEPFHGVLPIAVLPAPDGGAFAIVDATHHSAGHASLMRFDAQGDFEWLEEGEAVSVADGVAVAPDRIALAGSVSTGS